MHRRYNQAVWAPVPSLKSSLLYDSSNVVDDRSRRGQGVGSKQVSNRKKWQLFPLLHLSEQRNNQEPAIQAVQGMQPHARSTRAAVLGVAPWNPGRSHSTAIASFKEPGTRTWWAR